VILFKPVKKHAQCSSFYLMAKNVQPQTMPAKEILEEWKKLWYATTFEVHTTEFPVRDLSEEVVTDFLQEFSPRLVKLGSPMWECFEKGFLRAAE
jgi:hypothetical protein